MRTAFHAIKGTTDVESIAAVRHALSQSPLPADALAAQFKRSPKIAVQAVLDALEE